MDEVKTLQGVSSEETVESKFTVKFTDVAYDVVVNEKSFVSKKIKLLFIDAEWWITIQPHLYYEGYIRVKVHISRSTGQVDLENCKFSVAIKSTENKDQMTEWSEMTNDKIQYETDEVLFEYLNTDMEISVVLSIKRFDDPCIKSKSSNRTEDYRNIVDNISKIKDNSTFADFKFIVRGKEFMIHKNILAASSPVFARLFTSDMQEARENVCIVDSFKSETFDHLLEFIYRAKLPTNFAEIAQEIYEVADYYDLKRLKDICATEIHSQLSKDNAVEFYCWAFPYDSLDELKKNSWKKVKRDVLHIYFRIKNEPLPPEALKELIEEQHRHQQYLENLK